MNGGRKDEMGKKEPVPNRRYTGEFKVESVRPGESIGAHEAAKRKPPVETVLTSRTGGVHNFRVDRVDDGNALPVWTRARSRRFAYPQTGSGPVAL